MTKLTLWFFSKIIINTEMKVSGYTNLLTGYTESDTNIKIIILQIIGCKYFSLYSLNSLDIIIYLYSFICVILLIFILLIITCCIIIHPMICYIMILLLVSEVVRPARLVSYAFLYTTDVRTISCSLMVSWMRSACQPWV